MIHLGDCIEVMAGMEAESVDAVVTDPPYGLEFMGKEWDSLDTGLPQEAVWKGRRGQGGGSVGTDDSKPGSRHHVGYGGSKAGFKRCQKCGKRAFSGSPCKCEEPEWVVEYNPGAPSSAIRMQRWHERWAAEALRVTKPGGYLLAFGGTRTHHRLVCGLEDAGWIIRDELTWIYACLSDDTEILTDLGWVPYNRANEATHAAAFDTATGQLRWERIAAVHKYDHEGPMVHYGPALTTLNHRVVLSPESEVPLPSDADLHRLRGELRDVGSVPSGAGENVLPRLLAEAVVHASRAEAAGGSQGSLVFMRGVRDSDVEAGRMGEAHHRADVLVSVQRDSSAAVADIPAGDTGRLDRGQLGVLSPEDERREQPSLEGRRYHLQEARELLWSSLRAGTGMGVADGSQGQLRDGAPATDGGPVRLLAHALGVRQSREPRPDRQPPRQSHPLAGQPDPQAVRVGQGDRGDSLPPGDAPRLVDYAGVVWCITVPSGAFVARRNGVAFVTGNSGFPKGKANLKPAHEPIVLARKPGPLRPLGIDACRIESTPRTTHKDGNHQGTHPAPMDWGEPTGHTTNGAAGRWPSNVLLSDPALFDEPNPEVVGSGASLTASFREGDRAKFGDDYWGKRNRDQGASLEGMGYGDSGGYSRFFTYPRYFIVPKAGRGDREPVLRGQLESGGTGLFDDDNYRQPGETRGQHTARGPRENAHPTVKPTDLMRHLIRLVTPSGGTVLDPFLGSGSTAIAAELEGFPWIGIEQDASYVAIAEARLNGVQRGLGLDVPAPTRTDIGKQRGNKDEDGQPTLSSNRDDQLIWKSYQPDEEPAA